MSERKEHIELIENKDNWKCYYEIIKDDKHFIANAYDKKRDAAIAKAKKQAFHQLSNPTFDLNIRKITRCE